MCEPSSGGIGNILKIAKFMLIIIMKLKTKYIPSDIGKSNFAIKTIKSIVTKAVSKFAAGPATETKMSSRRGFEKFDGFIYIYSRSFSYREGAVYIS